MRVKTTCQTLILFVSLYICAVHGIQFTIYDARLSGGSTVYQGRVEVLTHRGWLPVCNSYSYSWSISRESKVLCQQLGYGVASTSSTSLFSNSLEFIFSCSGAESELSQCPYRFYREVTSCSYIVTVSCQPCTSGSVQLLGGIVPEAGTVYYCVNGVWNSVCDSNWDYKDAFVTCRQLGFPATGAVRYLNSYFGNQLQLQSNFYLNCFGNESSLAGCQNVTTSCNSENVAGVYCTGDRITLSEFCTDGSVRLSDGHDENEGRVEICSNRVWGTVWDGRWDILDALVVCRQLGYPRHSRVKPFYTYNSNFGAGTGPILFAYLNCDGSESTLADCSTYSSYYFGASHSSDAGVRCQRTTTTQSNCLNGDVRLMNGTTSYEGRVEICYDGVWGSVCDNNWDYWDAAIVCLQMGFQGTNATALSNSYFGDGNGPYHLNDVYCRGQEKTLLDCQFNNLSIILSRRCTPGNDAGVRCDASVCSHGEVRLFGSHPLYGNTGVAEVCINGRWADICGDVNRENVSRTFCRQLIGEQSLSFGYPCCPGVNMRNSGNVTLYNITCSDQSRRLAQDCSFDIVSGYTTAGCSLQEELVVGCYEQSRCTEGDVRLVDGNSTLEGRVEVCIQGLWGAIVASYLYVWDENDATVVCRQLGHPWNWALADRRNLFGRGNNRIIARDFRCAGVEEQLLNCSHSIIPLSSGLSFQSSSTAGVICQGDTSEPTECEHGDVRLVDGQTATEGRVEFCSDGYWATACDNSRYWSGGINQAKLICTQLKFPTYWTDYISGSPFGSNYQLPIVGLSCGTGASNISECQTYTQTNTYYCNHQRNMGVICRGLEYHKVIVQQLPLQESYEIGSQVTFECIAPQSLKNFGTLLQFYYRWFSTVRGGNFNNIYSSTGSATITTTIPTHHPSSANYYCQIYRNGHLLGTGKTTLKVKDLLQRSLERIQVHEQENISLHVATLNIDFTKLLLGLTWYHNGSVIVPDHDTRVTLSNNNKTLTITNFTATDGGVYKVQFNELLIHPYNKDCKDNIMSFSRIHPLLKPAVFCVNYVGSDCFEFSDETTSTQILVQSKDLNFQGTLNSFSLEADGLVDSVKELTYSSFRWYLSGSRTTSSLSTLQKHYQSLSQSLQLFNTSYEQFGRYEVLLTIDLYTYLRDSGCQQYYNSLVSSYLPRYLPLAAGYVDIDYYRDLTFSLDGEKQAATRNDGATLTCRASIQSPPFSMLSFIKNGQIVATSTSGLLQINTRSINTNPFGLHYCQLNASGVTFLRSYFLKEQANLKMMVDARNSNICSNINAIESVNYIEEALALKISSECHCNFNQDDFQDSRINCKTNGEHTYTATVEYSTDDGSETASIIAERIIGQAPFSMTVEGVPVTVTSACTDCRAPAKSLSPAAGGGLFVGGFAAAALIIGIILIIVLVVVKKRHTKSEDRSRSHRETKADPVRYASSGAQKKPFAKPLSKEADLSHQKDDYEVMEIGDDHDQPIYEETF